MKTFIRWLILVLFSFPLIASDKIKLVEVSKKNSFRRPLHMTLAPGDAKNLFVVEQEGFIKYLSRDNPAIIKTLLDIKDRVEAGGEKGLLGLAFHPKFQENGFIYLNYTAFDSRKKLATFISRFQVDVKTLLADPKSEKVLLTFHQPYDNHNGGTVTFGPDDQLYVATGDGGAGGDPHNHAQNKKSLLGKILRLDVDKENATPEIYALGMRNPWKISFDQETGDLWAADVGQNNWEEIDIIQKDKNYGWRIKEGTHCYNPPGVCRDKGLTDPVYEYRNSGGDCSITGGHVYRGKNRPEFRGSYIYGDFCSGKIWAFKLKTKSNKLLLNSGLSIASFGQDQEGELYVLDHQNGAIFRLQ